jgi:hypothetical protein
MKIVINEVVLQNVERDLKQGRGGCEENAFDKHIVIPRWRLLSVIIWI